MRINGVDRFAFCGSDERGMEKSMMLINEYLDSNALVFATVLERFVSMQGFDSLIKHTTIAAGGQLTCVLTVEGLKAAAKTFVMDVKKLSCCAG